jgi:hypothetical protein
MVEHFDPASAQLKKLIWVFPDKGRTDNPELKQAQACAPLGGA